MTFRVTILVSMFILFSSEILKGQDFDADSIYYTPIPKTYGLTGKETRVIRRNLQDTRDTILTRGPVYFLSLQTGPLFGCSSCGDGEGVSFTSSFANGITIGKKIRIGAGLGFDSYTGWTTLPAFASLSWDVFGNRNCNAVFVQFNYGTSKAWIQKPYQGQGFKRSEGGRMLAPQLGYRIKYHDLNISLVIGAKLQRVFSFYENPTWHWVDGESRQGTSQSTIQQDMIRFMVTMSVGWK